MRLLLFSQYISSELAPLLQLTVTQRTLNNQRSCPAPPPPPASHPTNPPVAKASQKVGEVIPPMCNNYEKLTVRNDFDREACAKRRFCRWFSAEEDLFPFSAIAPTGAFLPVSSRFAAEENILSLSPSDLKQEACTKMCE